ncbi:MAG: hypothetical protein ABIB47_01265 [Candidatus Woesearchaeota archaeon]
MDCAQERLGVRHREVNHSSNDIPKVKEFWKDNPNEAVIEFLCHIIADFRDTSDKLLNKRRRRK